MSTAQSIIDALTAHFQSLSPPSLVALELQSPDAWIGGDHLSPGLQERCVPPHIVEALNVWLTEQCESHISGRTSSHDLPSPFVDCAPDPPLRRSPFGPLLDSVPGGSPGAPANPATVSHPFIDTPVRDVLASAPIQFTEGGPVRFVEMPLDVYCARLKQMVSQGRFEHIGPASIRLEGATAWGCLAPCGSLVNCAGEQAQAEVWCPLPCGQPHSIFPWSSQGCGQVLVAHFLKVGLLRQNRSARQFNETRFRIRWLHLSNPHSRAR